MRSAISVSFRIRQSQYSVYSQTVAVIKIVCMRICTVTCSNYIYGNNARSVLEMGSFVSVVSSAELMQKYEIGLYLLTAARTLIGVL